MFIKMTNPGSFDIVSALSMIGASVKQTDEPIGLYGSGVKYALAQALRMKIPIVFVDETTRFDLVNEPKSFRGKDFGMVALRAHEGDDEVIHHTGITAEFGREDWTDPWFIFREFYSNMLDEGGTASLVESVDAPQAGEFSVYLPLADFQEVWENLSNYFTDIPNNTLVPGTGRVFKKGVWVGNVSLPFNCRVDNVKITETRTMDRFSCFDRITEIIEDNPNQQYMDFLFTKAADWTNIDIRITNEWWELLRSHYEQTPKYCLTPPQEFAILDVRYMGFEPVYLPKAMMSDYVDRTMLAPESIRTFHRLTATSDEREPTEQERAKIQAALDKVAQLGEVWELSVDKVKVLIDRPGRTAVMGKADIQNNTIAVSWKLLYDLCPPIQLVSTVLHEVGHLVSNAKDNTREFTDCFVMRLAELL